MAADVAPAERIRRNLADAWGEMGAAWGVAPAIARVHGYLLSRRAPMTEREVREGLVGARGRLEEHRAGRDSVDR